MRDTETCCEPHRRGFLGGTLAGGLALVAFGAAALPDAAQAAALTEAERNAMSPDQVIQAMLDGNARFLSGARRKRDFLDEMRTSAAGQFPMAVTLSCIDSRAPVEAICDLGIGDTFSARVAGNAVNDDILGSMEYSCAVVGAKIALVLGHTKCGAIKGAIDNVVLGNLTLLLARFKSAMDATVYDGDRSSHNYAFVDKVATTNVRMVIETIRERSDVLAGLETQGKIKIVGTMYDVSTGKLALV